MTRQVLYAGLAGVICLVSLLAGSGIGQVYNLSLIASVTVSAAYLLFPLGRTLYGGYVRRRELLLTLGLVLVIAVWPAVKGYKTLGMEYGWLLLLPYVLGMLSMSQQDVRAIGFTCGVFGLVVVAAKLYFGIFDGWNENTIAMAGFFGCAVCSAAPWTSWGGKIFHKVLLVTMAVMALQLDSRSCVVGVLVLGAFAFGILKPRYFARKTWLRRLMLVSPAIIAVATVLFQNSQIFDSLNAWSMEYFSKPIFNGRNTIWQYGLEQVVKTPWLGTGYINNGYWHNCAITTMTAFGLVGYGLWVWYFENIMMDTQQWENDLCLRSCIIAFLSVMVQQSFELSLVSTDSVMMPYLIIGIMLGRMRYLRSHQRSVNTGSYPSRKA